MTGPNIGTSSGLFSFAVIPTIGINAARFDKLGKDIRSFRVPLKRAVKEVMVPSIRANFDAEGRPTPWAPLSAYTLTRKIANGQGTKILYATGALKRVASQINMWTITTEEAIIQDLPDKVWYGKVHQSGNKKIPARPFLIIQDEDSDAIVQIFVDWFEERFNEIWPG